MRVSSRALDLNRACDCVEYSANVFAQKSNRGDDNGSDQTRQQAILQGGYALAAGLHALQKGKAVSEHNQFLS